MIGRLNHVAIAVPDLDAAVAQYRDLLGKANQVLATQAEAVYFMVAGLPVDIKALASPTLLQSPGPYHIP